MTSTAFSTDEQPPVCDFWLALLLRYQNFCAFAVKASSQLTLCDVET